MAQSNDTPFYIIMANRCFEPIDDEWIEARHGTIIPPTPLEDDDDETEEMSMSEEDEEDEEIYVVPHIDDAKQFGVRRAVKRRLFDDEDEFVPFI
jgi:hypothetical protein